LIGAIGDESWRVRKTAVEILTGFPCNLRVIGALIMALSSSDNAGMRNSAVEILTSLGRGENGRLLVDTLLEHMSTRDQDVRKFIVDILGDIGDSSAAPSLIGFLNEDADENVRLSIIEALGKLSSREALDQLINILQGDDQFLKFAALDSLGQIVGRNEDIDTGPVVLAIEQPLLRKAGLKALGRIGGIKELAHLTRALEDSKRSNRETAIDSIVNLIDNFDDDQKRQAKSELDFLVSSTAEGFIVQALEIGSEALRFQTIKLAGWLGRRDFVPALIELAEEEDFRPFIGESLVKMGSAAVSGMVDIFSTQHTIIRALICSVLGRIGDGSATDLLIHSLGDDKEVRNEAAYALARMKAEPAIGKLIQLLDDEELEVRSVAVEALCLYGPSFQDEINKKIKPLLQVQSSEMRRNALRILGSVGGTDDSEAMTLLLKDADPGIRREALVALARMDPETAAKHLINALADEDRDVKLVAINWIGQLKLTEAQPPLITLVHSDDMWVSAASLRALGDLGDKSSLEIIDNSLKSTSGLVVIAAIDALREYSRRFPEKQSQVLALLISIFEHDDAEVVKEAAGALSEFSSELVVTHIPELLEHRHWNVRNQAVKLIKEKRLGEMRKNLSSRLEKENDPLVLQTIAEALFEIDRGN
jgi:HEAT repeat protein